MSQEHPFVAIVDDDESVRKALRRLLCSAGLKVETFATGADFLQSLKEHKPDCIVLDVHMPEMTGFDLQARLAASGPLLPVVIITGYDSTETQDRVMAAGAVAYLRKPINDKALLDAIHSAVGGAPA